VEYLIILSTAFLLNGCCSTPPQDVVQHGRVMFAQGARNYCTEQWLIDITDNNTPYYEDKCDEVYNKFYWKDQ